MPLAALSPWKGAQQPLTFLSMTVLAKWSTTSATAELVIFALVAFNALTLLVGLQEGHMACKKWGMVEVGTG